MVYYWMNISSFKPPRIWQTVAGYIEKQTRDQEHKNMQIQTDLIGIYHFINWTVSTWKKNFMAVRLCLPRKKRYRDFTDWNNYQNIYFLANLKPRKVYRHFIIFFYHFLVYEILSKKFRTISSRNYFVSKFGYDIYCEISYRNFWDKKTISQTATSCY